MPPGSGLSLVRPWTVEKTRAPFLSFLCVCPEPVLVNHQFSCRKKAFRTCAWAEAVVVQHRLFFLLGAKASMAAGDQLEAVVVNEREVEADATPGLDAAWASAAPVPPPFLPDFSLQLLRVAGRVGAVVGAPLRVGAGALLPPHGITVPAAVAARGVGALREDAELSCEKTIVCFVNFPNCYPASLPVQLIVFLTEIEEKNGRFMVVV